MLAEVWVKSRWHLCFESHTLSATDRDIMASWLEIVWEPFWKILVPVAVLGFLAVLVCRGKESLYFNGWFNAYNYAFRFFWPRCSFLKISNSPKFPVIEPRSIFWLFWVAAAILLRCSICSIRPPLTPVSGHTEHTWRLLETTSARIKQLNSKQDSVGGWTISSTSQIYQMT